MKKLFCCLVIITFSLSNVFLSTNSYAASNLADGIKDLAQQISTNMTRTDKKKIAVVEFSNLDGEITTIGQYLAEALITELLFIAPGQFEVVERRQLMKVIREKNLTTSALVGETMQTVGKILGVDAIVTGSITDLQSDVVVNARLIAVDTAKIFAVARTNIPNIGLVKKLITPKINGDVSKDNSTTSLNPNSVYANRNSRTFHKHNCSQIDKTNAIDMGSPKTALSVDAIPCKDCNPTQLDNSSIRGQHPSVSHTPANGNWKVTLNRELGKVYVFKLTLHYVEKKRDNLIFGLVYRNMHKNIKSIRIGSNYEKTFVIVDTDKGKEYHIKTITGISTHSTKVNPGVEKYATFTFPFPYEAKNLRFESYWTKGIHLSIPLTIPPTE